MPKKLSLVIPCFNKINFTTACLNDLSYLDPSMHEIIVVDNNSTDGTEEKIRDLQKKISNLIYAKMEKNTGFGFACNRGYTIAKAPLVMFLNNDIRVSSHLPSWTDAYIEELTKNPYQIISPTGGYIEPKRGFQFCYETSGEKPFNYLSGWMLASTKITFDKLRETDNEGPFRADQYFAFFEDGHLSFKAKELAIQMRIVPNNSVTHFGHVTAKTINMSKLYNESRKKFIDNWGNK